MTGCVAWVQREANRRGSFFSSLYWVIWAWNVHNTPATPVGDPSQTATRNILVSAPKSLVPVLHELHCISLFGMRMP